VIDVSELAAFAAVPAPTGVEEARVAWLEQRLDGAPGVRRRDAVGNLVWSFGEDRAELLVMAHVDTVFDADTPLRFERDGDFLVGPGVGDNATAVMATVWALERVGAPPPGLVVAFTVGEEGLGNLRGARQVCADLDPMRVIAVEGHGLDHVVTEHVGSVRARLAVSGPGGHSWRDRGTPSALHALIELGGELVAEGVNVGRMSGGGAVNAIASAAEMFVELRSLDDGELAAFESRLNAVSGAPPLSLTCEVVGRRGAGQIDPGHPLVRSVLQARRTLGLAEAFGAGSTDANAAAVLGIPAVGIGCAHGEGMHTVHERIDLVSLETGVRQLEAVLTAAADL
jgi:acetylornithine deacetylase/succinyl-diaminopimelate desuccinylase-like protein